MNVIGRWLGIVGLFAAALSPSVALAVEATVRLKNGGWVQGDVVEMLPNDHVTVRTTDGSIHRIAWAEVERVDEAIAVAPGPAIDRSAEDGRKRLSEERATALTLSAFGSFGIAGSAQVEGNSSTGGELFSKESDGDLGISVGGGVQLDAPLHRHFSIGGIVSAFSWNGDYSNAPRSLFVDVVATPRLRFPFAMGGELMGVFFVQAPVGLALAYMADPWAGFEYEWRGEDIDLEYSTGPAFAVGLSAGLLVMLSERVGVTIDAGFMARMYSATAEVTSNVDGPSTEDVGVLFLQPRVHAGLVFGL